MAKWRVTPGTINNSISGGIEYDGRESFWKIYQDEKPFLEQAKQDREAIKKNDVGYKKFATNQTHPCLLYTSPSPRD